MPTWLAASSADHPTLNSSPLWKWIDDGKSILVVGGRLLDELEGIGRAAEQIRIWAQAGLVGFVAPEEVEAETASVAGTGLCVSDDEHVIALARASGARLLCSEDQLLHADFGNRELISSPRGAVYQNATHTHLLRHRQGCRFKAPADDR